MSLVDEVKSVFNVTQDVVMETTAYTISLLRFTSPRTFTAFSAETKRNCTVQEAEETLHALKEFFKHVRDTEPCYFLLDTTRTDAFTLAHVQMMATQFKALRPLLETRLVGSVVKYAEEGYDNYLTKMLEKVYTPVRPLAWWERPGDCVSFIKYWEGQMFS